MSESEQPKVEAEQLKQVEKAPRKRRAALPAAEQAAGVRYDELDSGDAEAWRRLRLPEDSDDPRWDPRMDLALDRAFVLDLANNGVDVDLDVTADVYGPGTYGINDGRTRVRAVPEANAIRKKKGLPALVVGLKVRPRDDVDAMRTANRLNRKRRQSDAVTDARAMMRYLDLGLTEEEIGEDFGVKTQQVHEYLSLLSLPKEVQALVTSGKLGVSLAVQTARLDPAEVARRAKAMVSASASGRVTKKAAERAAGVSGDADGLGRKAIKQLVKKLRAARWAGQHGEVVRFASVEALEVVLDARREDELWDRLDKLAKGHVVQFRDETPGVENSE